MKLVKISDETILFDPSDRESMTKLMDKHGESGVAFAGKNKDGEDTFIYVVSREKVTVRTNQNNGWVRETSYLRDGTKEETYDGRWDRPNR